ncbi:MAG: cob(I)yrinic acid a,c-diamide adenosyltransferase [Desulfurispora sp.]|uniref:cob(I)yrinic acid a,c-diamide adenosyltransferase n=1 Tax=Desulfurispora sp. TaxID=3014275 RepID=UPI00404A3A77
MAQGLIMVFTGNGKGKTTAALGMAVRARGQGLRVLVVQFIKGGQSYGELEALGALGIEIRPLGLGFVRHAAPEQMEQHRAAARAALDEVRREMLSGRWDMLVLDEINYAVHFGLIQEQELLELLAEKPPALHLVLTGRYARPAVVERADLVSEIQEVKHPFARGVPAQKGVEF